MKKRIINLFFQGFISIIFNLNASLVFGNNDSTEIFNSGKKLFNTQCASCHNVHKEIIGPMLASITKKRTPEWLMSFIKNSQNVIVSGDEYANFLFLQYNHSVMPSFNKKLSETEINKILFYIEKESVNPTEDLTSYSPINQNYKTREVGIGEDLFQRHCSSCHFENKEGYGPSLGSVTKRRPKEWLHRFINNSQEVIKSGDDYANYLYDNFNQKRMLSFDYLNKDEINAILDYIEFASASPPQTAGVNGRKVEKRTAIPGKSVISYNINIKKTKHSELFFKVFFITISIGAAIAHGFAIVMLYRYLSKK